MPPVARSYSVEPTRASVGLAAPGRPRIERRCSLVVAVTVAVTVTVAVVVVVVVAMSPVALLGSPAVSWGVDQGRVVAGGTGPGPAGVPAGDGPADRSMGQGPASCRRPWVAPVDAAVVDPFRPPPVASGRHMATRVLSIPRRLAGGQCDPS
jgi:hypothetical protein